VAEAQLEQERRQCSNQSMKYEEVVERLNEAEMKVKEGELLRRKLHNTILVCSF
jgi:kinesin family protein C1